jgi:hypothetical protein
VTKPRRGGSLVGDKPSLLWRTPCRVARSLVRGDSFLAAVKLMRGCTVEAVLRDGRETPGRHKPRRAAVFGMDNTVSGMSDPHRE